MDLLQGLESPRFLTMGHTLNTYTDTNREGERERETETVRETETERQGDR